MLITVTTLQGKGKVKFPPFCAMKEYRGRVDESGFGPTVKTFFSGPRENNFFGPPVIVGLLTFSWLVWKG